MNNQLDLTKLGAQPITPFDERPHAIVIGSGFEHSQTSINTINPFEHPSFNVELQKEHVHPSLLLPNHITATRWIEEDLWKYLAFQSTMLIYYQEDQIITQPILAQSTIIQTGLHTTTEHGKVLSWPWQQNLHAGFGAIQSSQLNTLQVLDQAGHQQRLVFVDWELFEYLEAEIANATQTYPYMDGIWTTDTDFFEKIQIGTASIPHRIIGEVTWFFDEDVSTKIEMEAALLENRYATGNGPFIQIQGNNPSTFSQREIHLDIQTHHPEWMEISHLLLWNEQGWSQEWEITESAFHTTLLVPNAQIYFAAVWSDQQRFDNQWSWALQQWSTQD